MADFHAPATRRANGPSLAVMVSAGIALVTLALVQIRGHVSAPFPERVFDVGKAWMRGADGIGPHSGKATIALLAWVVSWPVLAFGWRNKDLDVRQWSGATLAPLAIATLLLWPPVWYYFE